MNLLLPLGQSRGQVHPLGPGEGELFQAVMSRTLGGGGGANRRYGLHGCRKVLVKHIPATYRASRFDVNTLTQLPP